MKCNCNVVSRETQCQTNKINRYGTCMINDVYLVDPGHFRLKFERLVVGRGMEKELPQNFGLRFGEMEDLPDELKAQIQAIKVGDVERTIIAMLRDDFEGIANLDEILVGLFRRKGEVFDRQLVSNKLYRMNKSGLVVSVPKKKGVYRSAS
jgi:hypothetical protein